MKANNRKDEFLTEEQQEFIRLLREKAVDTPVPLAVQPEMILQRLPDSPAEAAAMQKKRRFRWRWLRVPSWKTVSGMAVALTACVALLLTGRQPVQQFIQNGGLTISSDPASDSSVPVEMSGSSESGESSAFSDPESEPSSEETSSDGSSLPQHDQGSTPSVSSPASTPSAPSVSSAPTVNSGGVDESVENGDNETGSVTSTETTDSADVLIPTGEPDREKTIAVDPNDTVTIMPSGNGEDYAAVYEALQRSVTPENATRQYSTAVLSAGISADGLEATSQKTIVATDGVYFYTSTQNSLSVSIQKGSDSAGSVTAKIYVEFETPSFTGMTVSSSAVTDCFYSNQRLFVVGTVSYTGTEADKTISAVNCYDVSDPSSPRLLASAAQDGTMVGAAMSGSYLYLFSRYYPDTSVQESNPAGYIPLFYGNGEASMPAPENISISQASTDSYIVAASYSVKDPQDIVDCSVIQGCGRRFFLGDGGLYLFDEESSDMQTLVSGINFSAGHFTVTSEVTINGLLSNLTAPDEYGSTLRVLTTSYGETNDTHLYVFSRSLELLGKSESFLEDAVLRSVRFDRNSFYYTLYGFDGQVYEIDLSDLTGLSSAVAAEKEEEALISVNADGNYTVRLTGSKGRTELTLTLRLSGLEKGSVTLPVANGYTEGGFSLEYLGDNLVCLIYQEGYNDICKVYRCGSDGLTEIISTSVFSSEDGKGYLQDGRFFLITSERTLIFDLSTGEPIAENEETP